jgi:hypothetical protein
MYPFYLIIVYVFVYFTNTRLLLAKIEKIYINVVVYKTIFHERFSLLVYILTHFELSLHFVNIIIVLLQTL